MVLLGACPSGTGSNVMTYIAKGDTALSITVSSVNTILAPLLTPYLFLLLAGTMIPIDVTALFLDIVKIALIPAGGRRSAAHMRRGAGGTPDQSGSRRISQLYYCYYCFCCGVEFIQAGDDGRDPVRGGGDPQHCRAAAGVITLAGRRAYAESESDYLLKSAWKTPACAWPWHWRTLTRWRSCRRR